MTETTSEKHIISAKISMLKRYPFYGGLVSTLKLKTHREGDKSFRASTDGYSTFFYNPVEIEKMNKEELIVTLAHEVGHITLKHAIRVGGRDQKIFNIAADYVVNAILLEDGIGTVALFRKMRILYDEKFRGMSVEEVYDIIKKNPSAYSQQGDFPIDHETWGAGIGEGQGNKPNGNENEKNNNGTDNNKGIVEKWGLPTGNLSESKRQQIESEINDRINKAITIEQQVRGDKSSKLSRDFIKKLEEPRVDWRQLLAQYLEDTSTNNTYRRFNKKYLPMGVLLPTPNVERTKINIMLDVSGSIGDELLRKFISDVWYLLSANDSYEEVNIYQVDTQILSHVKVSIGDDIGSIASEILTRKGTGGTNFNEFFKYLEDNNNQSITIVFTDGDATIPDEPPIYPVIFIYTIRKLDWGINILYDEE